MSPHEFWLGVLAVGYLAYRLIYEGDSAASSTDGNGDDTFAGSRFASNDDDDHSFGDVNIDGTPMVDDFLDVHGNAFGIVDDWMSLD